MSSIALRPIGSWHENGHGCLPQNCQWPCVVLRYPKCSSWNLSTGCGNLKNGPCDCNVGGRRFDFFFLGGGSCFALSLHECSLHVHSFGGLKNDKGILFWPGVYLFVAVGSYWTELGLVLLSISDASLTWEEEAGWYAWNWVEYDECEYMSLFFTCHVSYQSTFIL